MTALLVVLALAVGIGLGAAVATSLARRSPEDAPAPAPAPVEDIEPEPAPAESAAVLLTRLDDALEQVEQGVVICDGDGVELFRNRVAQGFLEARDGRVLVEAAVRELLADAVGRSARGATRRPVRAARRSPTSSRASPSTARPPARWC